MSEQETFGKMEAKRGDKCENTPYSQQFTTPCCYADVSHGDTQCPDCGASIKCEFEDQPCRSALSETRMRRKADDQR